MSGRNRIDGFFNEGPRTADVRPKRFPFGNVPAKQPDMEHQVLLLKVNKLEEKLDICLDLIRELKADKYPRFIGTREACKVLGVGRSTLMSRVSKGVYPFAFKDKESGEWRFNLFELNMYVKGLII